MTRASALASSGGLGSLKSMPARTPRMASAASAISGEWAATDTGSSMARFAPSSFAIARDASIAGRSPETTTWPGEFRLATPNTPCSEARATSSGRRSSSRPMTAAIRPSRPGARRLHLLAADAHEADGVREVQRAGGDQGRVLAHRVPGGEGGLGDVDAELVPAFADGLEVGDRRGEQRGLAVLGPVELLLGALPGEPADRLAERGVGGGEHARRRRGRPRRARGPCRRSGCPGRGTRRRSDASVLSVGRLRGRAAKVRAELQE